MEVRVFIPYRQRWVLVVRLIYRAGSGNSMQSEGEVSGAGSLGLCLDFTDTLDWRTSDHAKDTLASYADLVMWSRNHGAIGDDDVSKMLRLANAGGTLGDDVLKEARVLRDTIYRIFSAAAHGRRADATDVGMLNGFLARAMAKREVQVAGDGYRWGWCSGESADKMLYPLAQSAAELLTSEDLGRVKECANEEQGCGSLFLDSSKSQTRRWCSMKSCGNRMKFKSYYDRHSRGRAGARSRAV
jgi:predicted RNA-binding Zn ribbon-like protein